MGGGCTPMYMRNIAELSEMPAVAFKRFRINRRLKTWN